MINSIDMMTMLPRTAEAADIQGRETSVQENATNQPAVQFQQKVEHDARQAVEAQKSETEDYDSEGSGGRGAQSRGKKKKKPQKEAPVAPRSNSSFDITI